MKKVASFLDHEAIIYIFAGIISCLFSAVFNHLDPVVNPDGICYLSSAASMATLGLKGAMQLCAQAKWPLYAALIYAVTFCTHLSFLHAAFFLNACFTAFSVIAFIAIVKALGGSKRTLWLAALVILCAHEWNNLRVDIIRDHGYWCFYLISLWSLLAYFQTRAWQYAFYFSFSLLVATLFRIEGFFFLSFLPFVAFFVTGTWGKKTADFFQLNALLLFISAFFLPWLLWHPQYLAKLGRVAEVGQQTQHALQIAAQHYLHASTVLRELIGPEGAHDVPMLTAIAFVGWYVMNVILSLSLLYFLLTFFAWTQKIFFKATANKIIIAYLLINLIITMIFLAEYLFISKRYTIGLVLVLMLWTPFGLERLLANCSRMVYRQVFFVVLLLFGLSLFANFYHTGGSKAYLAKAGFWLAQQVPANATLYSNDYFVMYYSKHFGNAIFKNYDQYQDVKVIAHHQWQHFDYLAIRRDKDDKTVESIVNEIHLKPVQVFAGAKGKQVAIYKLERLS